MDGHIELDNSSLWDIFLNSGDTVIYDGSQKSLTFQLNYKSDRECSLNNSISTSFVSAPEARLKNILPIKVK